jgi:hypothetical protein
MADRTLHVHQCACLQIHTLSVLPTKKAHDGFCHTPLHLIVHNIRA